MISRITLLFGFLFILSLVSCQSTLFDTHSELHIPESYPTSLPEDANGDFACTTCVIVVDILKNELEEHSDDIHDFLTKKLCTYLPESYQTICTFIVKNFEPLIIELLKQHASPSRICNSLKLFNCNGCTLDDPNLNGLSDSQMDAFHRLSFFHHLSQDRKSNALNDELKPVIDMDSDYFSSIHTIVRGANWRGMDCDDSRADIRPGLWRDERASEDSNCNGIHGANVEGKLYDDMYCYSQDKSSLKTIVMFGDSASSHFHIPPEWFKAQNITKLLSAVDEFDWPQLSWATGFDPSIGGESVYLKMRAKNLCNHRSYINVGHNGHRAEDLLEQVKALSHHPNEKPYLAFLAYIGNDVCKPSIDRITTDKQFEEQIVRGLTELDKVAPAGSKLLAMGLVDGRILWNEMANRTHPLGATYSTVYSFLSCTNANPCNTWLNIDQKSRDYTSNRAAQLSQVLKRVVSTLKLKNVEMDYINFPLQEAVDYVRSIGVSPSVLIEQVDGFHPSDFAHRFFARYIWQYLEKNRPNWVGIENPYNSYIKAKFGEQGGH